MKQIVMLAGAAALSFAGPAFAKPGHGQGNGHGQGYGYGREDHGDRLARGSGYNDDRDDEDRDDEDEGFNGQRMGYGAGGCPPGLAKKTPACIPPGLARQQSMMGQNALAYGNRYAVPSPPYGYANPYAGAPAYNYPNPYMASPYGAYGVPAYGNGYNYQVDPQAQILQQLIGSLIR